TSFLDSGDKSQLPSIAPGTTIFVPVNREDDNARSDTGVNIFGQVVAPGQYPHKLGSNLLEYLMQAGGVNNFASVDKIRIINAGKPQLFNLTEYLDTGDVGLLPEVGEGATIFVPIVRADDQALDDNGINVFGQVISPGQYPYRTSSSLLDYLMQAGGVNNYASVDKIRVISGGEPRLFNLTQFLDTGDIASMPSIAPGATLFIPVKTEAVEQSGRNVYVMGEVFRPGTYELQPDTSFMEVLAQSGGPTRFADTRRLIILSTDGSVSSFDFSAYTDGDSQLLPPNLGAGDALFVSEKPDQVNGAWLKIPPNRAVSMLGAVNKPGRYQWSEEMGLLDLLGHAGGPTNKADTSKLTIIPGGEDAGKELVRFNFEEFHTSGAKQALPLIKGGYTVMMPELPVSPVDNKAQWVRQPSESSIYIMGAVGMPGRFAFTPQLNFLDILTAANGPSEGADLRHIQIRDRNNASHREFDLSAYMVSQDESLLPIVNAEDVVFIPYQNAPSRPINIIGAVAAPGRYEFNDDLNLVQLLAIAGGPGEDADLAFVRIKPSQGTAQDFDLVAWSKNTQLGIKELPPIQEGDTVIVPRQPESPIDNKQRWLQLESHQAIYILGEVGIPGRYAFNPQMSFLDILAAANGPTEAADFENIQVTYRRDGRVRTEVFDLSGYMSGDMPDRLPQVQSSDLILVPAKSDSLEAVNVIGAVNGPGRHGFKRGMNLADVLALAGGPNETGDMAHILIVPGGKRIGAQAVVFDFARFESQGESALPQVHAGDTVIVPELPIDPIDNKARWLRLSPKDAIYIMGEVGRPGRYAFNDNMGFLDILAAADGPTPTADYENIQITYRREDRTWTERFNLSEFLVSGNEQLLPKVTTGDLILVPSEDDSSDTINVIGEANSPGRVDYSLGMNLIDVIALARGYSERADTANIKIIPSQSQGRGGFPCVTNGSCMSFDLADFEAGGEGVLPPIGPGDTVIIPSLPDDDDQNGSKSVWVKQASEDSIYIMGAVGLPGRYAFNEKLHFIDILAAADGPSSKADLHNIRVSHRNGPYALVSEVNLALYFETGDEHLLPTVRPQDVIYVPNRDRQWLDVRKESTVRVLGAVNDPGRYSFNSDMTILDLLAEAGGVSGSADTHSILVINRSVAGNVSRRFDLRKFAGHGDFGMLPTLRAGDTIYVPEDDESGWAQFMETVRDLVSILSIVALIVAL
ncbi:MAG: SLBB domain-containing protein, partial [Oceanococcus sp.]